jgi:rSAM/selenodomain-associated transferase 1
VQVLGIFAKLPAPGAVKTRLGGPPERGAEVARAFLLDALERTESVDAERVVVFSPADAREEMARLVGPAIALVPQSSGDLGERLGRFIGDRLDAGAGRVVVIGTDSPTLPAALLARAFEELAHADLVLGPATDGGYYLVGCRRRLPIFDGIAWSRDTVLAETVARLTDPRWNLALLPPWYDVDTPEGWAMLRGHVRAMRRAGIDPGVRRTEAILDEKSDHG